MAVALGGRSVPQGLGVPGTFRVESVCRGCHFQTRAALPVGAAGTFYLG